MELFKVHRAKSLSLDLLTRHCMPLPHDAKYEIVDQRRSPLEKGDLVDEHKCCRTNLKVLHAIVLPFTQKTGPMTV